MEIIEMFFSIQGEGIHVGKPTFFIRTAICNLRCSWCLPGDVSVTTPGGRRVPIQEVRVGERVLAYDPLEETTRYTGVEALHERLTGNILQVSLESGHEIAVTPGHPVYTAKGWRLGEDLAVGHRVLVLDRQMGAAWARVSQIDSRSEVSKVYNLTCSPLQSFFANDVLTHNCDTAYSWERGVEMSVAEIMREVGKQRAKSVCLTGGEPLLWKDAGDLIRELVRGGYEVVIETSGSISIKEVPRDDGVCISMDIKCPSSGMEDKMEFENIPLLRRGDQLKFVIADETDYRYARDVLQKHDPPCEVVLQPEGGRRLLPLAKWVLRDNLGVRVLPQLHKLIWPEKTEGV